MGAHARRIACLATAVVLTQSVGLALAARPTTLRAVRYHGYEVRVPRSWPVYDLAKNPRVCVRFNRHAVYLGRPSSEQLCPADAAVGRTEAILIEPLARTAAGAGAASDPLAPSPGESSFVVRSAGVAVTATWSGDRGTVARALRRRSLVAPLARAGRAARAPAGARAHAAAVYTGLGFDPCNAPSPNAMAAWGSSPYRAIGIYIGGTNAACSQPNLTPQWVSSEVAAGWHLIPTYVGLQAPSNECGCAGITPGQASAQGAAAASDAVADAQALDIPAGNPIYFDMEAYSQTASNTSAVLTFLSAWTAGLHADGYVSGVYSSAGSGISDLVGAGATFAKPDDIWIAEWNDAQTTASAFVPAADWSNHQRLHQYSGSHNETYGGVTINIDGDYLDGATAGAGGPPPPPPPPALGVSPVTDGTTNLSMTWAGAAAAAAWQVWAGRSPNALTPITAAPVRGVRTQIAVRDAAPYFAAAPLASSGQTLAAAAMAATPPHIAIFGRSAFVPSGGALVGVPTGCYTNAPCHVATTVSAGRTVLARTRPEYIGSDGAGLLWFKLTSQGRTLLARARSRRLAVQVTARDASGTAADTTINLIPFSTSGRGPSRGARQASPLRIVGTTDFVSSAGVGGILAGCFSVTPCFTRTTISVGRTVIASAGPEFLGGDELGYLIFSLTARGRSLLARAGGNQLGARVSITNGTATASGQVALVGFS
ncbi:MAG: DUF1906 domain-containing protein [Solirubrobacterales bacterium]|nr:DUF1906 domain-containing protein [Solirubrobacterales bacterium]